MNRVYSLVPGVLGIACLVMVSTTASARPIEESGSVAAMGNDHDGAGSVDGTPVGPYPAIPPLPGAPESTLVQDMDACTGTDWGGYAYAGIDLGVGSGQAVRFESAKTGAITRGLQVAGFRRFGLAQVAYTDNPDEENSVSMSLGALGTIGEIFGVGAKAAPKIEISLGDAVKGEGLGGVIEGALLSFASENDVTGNQVELIDWPLFKLDDNAAFDVDLEIEEAVLAQAQTAPVGPVVGGGGYAMASEDVACMHSGILADTGKRIFGKDPTQLPLFEDY